MMVFLRGNSEREEYGVGLISFVIVVRVPEIQNVSIL